MAIVRMKRIRLIAMTRDREELLRQLQRAGCVEICQPETDPADPEEWAGLTRPDGSALARSRERQQTLSQAIEILRRWAPEKTSLLAPKPSISQRELADQGAYDQALRDAEEICGQERALAALRHCGLTPQCVPIRGGTDGARLSFMGLPCPNLGTGGRNCHGVQEYVSVQEMEKAVEVLQALLLKA